MSGPGSGIPEGMSGGGISCGAGGWTTSGAGTGLGSLGWLGGMALGSLRGNAGVCCGGRRNRNLPLTGKCPRWFATAIALPEWLVIRAWLGARGL